MRKVIDSIRDFGYRTADKVGYGVKRVLPGMFAGYVIFSLGSHNGCIDSDRTKEAARHHKPENPVKTVVSVEEHWRDNSDFDFFASMMGGGGYNPHVTRRVVFDDGSQAILNYRTEAWKSMKRWLNGEEFDPKPGEKYEVVPEGGIEIPSFEYLDRVVRKVD